MANGASGEFDTVNSVNNLIHHTLPTVVNLILEDDSGDFGMRLLRAILEFIRRLFVILVLCMGRLNTIAYIRRIVEVGMGLDNGKFISIYFFYSLLLFCSLLCIDMENFPIRAFKLHILTACAHYFDEQIIDRSDVQEFLVIRMPAAAAVPLIATAEVSVQL